MKEVTLKTIAEKANVSIGTVVRALKNEGRIKQETKELVLQIAFQLGYKPNTFARALSTNKRTKILGVLPSHPNYFWNDVLSGMMDVAENLQKYKCDVDFIRTDTVSSFSVFDHSSQEEIAQVDGLVVVPTVPMQEFISHFTKRNIPVVHVNCDAQEKGRICYVGQNTYASGRLAGELMGKFLQGKGNVFVLNGGHNVEAFVQRQKGFGHVLKEDYPDIKITDVLEYHEDESEAQKFATEILESGKADGIFLTSLSGLTGIIQSLYQKEYGKNPVIVGYDYTEDVGRALADHLISASISQEPYLQGKLSLQLMAHYLLNDWRPTQTQIYTNMRVIFKNSLFTTENHSIPYMEF